jgi:FlaA1/EpsC-like NDP-sugar epimerase
MSLDALTERAAQVLLRLRNRHFFFLDLLIFALVPALALMLRVDDAFSNPRYLWPLLVYTLAGLPVWVGVFIASGMYSRNWQYASIAELGVILKAVFLATALNSALFFFVLRPLGLIPESFPRSIPFLTGLLILVLVGGTRLSVRLVDRLRRQREFAGRSYKQLLVFGAGEAGQMMVRELQRNPQLGLNAVAFLDDDPKKHRTFIHGVPVVGGRDSIASVVRDYHVEQAIIAMPTASGRAIREIAALCLDNGLAVKTVPGMFELLNGSVTVNKLRDVEIDDLLRREPVREERDVVAPMLRGKRVLVTGAGGSIGGELCRQIARCEPEQVILLGHGENSIFFQKNELVASFPEVAFEAVIADVRDEPRIRAVMARYQPEIVFHAAAHKHVSLMELNVEDAVLNNVHGTRVVLDAVIEHGGKAFVLISTDKAVKPTSVMGATKRVAELYVHARALETGNRYVAVRFGNVLGSRGSVVPLFKQQIARGGPVTVTHPDVRRYFMTIPEAVQLVLQAATLGRGGEIFALDMGEPVRIVDLAEDLIRLSGLQVGQDIDIVFTGLRPGEKLREELFVPAEAYERTVRAKIFVARNGLRATSDAHAELYAAMDKLTAYAKSGATWRVLEQLADMLPAFRGGTSDERCDGFNGQASHVE